MPVVLVWLRLELRRRWRSLAVLTLLIGVAGTAVLTAAAGARRQASAVDRLLARTRPATAAILANTPGFDWDRVRALPEVEALTRFGASFAIEGLPPAVEADVALDDGIQHRLERPVVYAGRIPNPARSDEAVVTRAFVAHFHRGVGGRFTVVVPTPAELQAQAGSGPDGRFTGPRLTEHIVGVVGSLWFGDQPHSLGGAMLSAGVARRYRDNVVGPARTAVVNALVRLRGGAAALPRLRTDVARIGDPGIDVWDVDKQFAQPLRRQSTFESRCLLAFGAAALLAAVFLIGQAISRYSAACASELGTLRSLGLTPAQTVAAAAAPPLVAAVAGAGLAGAGAAVASRWFPIGTAALVEPAPGIALDWTVLGIGAAGILALVAITAALAGRRAGRPGAPPAGRSLLATAMARRGLAVPVVFGTRLALEPGQGRSAVPVRPAFLGAVIGVLGVVAAWTFSHGVSDAAGHPERFGQTYQLVAFLGDNAHDYASRPALAAALRTAPQVSAMDDARVSVATGPGGGSSVTLYSHSDGPKQLPVVVTAGRMPERADEVLLAPQSLAGLHAHIGSPVTLTGTRGSHRLRVTGAGLVPTGFHNSYSDGGWVTDNGYDQLFRGHKFRLAYVTLRPGARTDSAGARLTQALHARDKTLAGVSFAAPDPLISVYELQQVERLPIILGLFLAALALGAVGHGLATTIRRRGHDLAVLRVLGMTPWQCRATVVTQASVLAAAGLVFGVPAGLALGRTVWRAVADYTPVQYVAPVAVVTLLVIAPAALLAANALAAWPARSAARLRVADVLRAE